MICASGVARQSNIVWQQWLIMALGIPFWRRELLFSRIDDQSRVVVIVSASTGGNQRFQCDRTQVPTASKNCCHVSKRLRHAR